MQIALAPYNRGERSTHVENAVRHGVVPRESGGRITVRAQRTAGRLRVEVEDDGPGFAEHVLADAAHALDDDDRVHIGLDNTRRRLELICGARQSLTLANVPAGNARLTIDVGCRYGARHESVTSERRRGRRALLPDSSQAPHRQPTPGLSPFVVLTLVEGALRRLRVSVAAAWTARAADSS